MFLIRQPTTKICLMAQTNVDFTEARGSEWQWHQLGHMQVCTRTFQFAIQIDSIRYVNRFESIRFVKKIRLSIH